MTPLDLLDELQKKLEDILKDVAVITGEAFSVYKQNPPAEERKRNGENPAFNTPSRKYPYCSIELGTGQQTSPESSNQNIMLVFVAKITSENMQGYRDISNAIERIRQKLLADPYVRVCRLNYPISWTMDVGDKAHPFYVGAVNLTFEIPSYIPDDQYC